MKTFIFCDPITAKREEIWYNNKNKEKSKGVYIVCQNF